MKPVPQRRMGLRELEKRRYHREVRKIERICEENNVDIFVSGNDADFLSDHIAFYICILSQVDANIESHFYPDIESEAIFISIYDYELLKDVLLS